MDYHWIWCRDSWWSSDFSSRATMRLTFYFLRILTTTGWSAMKVGKDTCHPLTSLGWCHRANSKPWCCGSSPVHSLYKRQRSWTRSWMTSPHCLQWIQDNTRRNSGEDILVSLDKKRKEACLNDPCDCEWEGMSIKPQTSVCGRTHKSWWPKHAGCHCCCLAVWLTCGL